jgi:hypothetical protein
MNATRGLTWKMPVAIMVSLSNHEGLAGTAVRRLMVRQARHEAMAAVFVEP